jgi:hypothetical protein
MNNEKLETVNARVKSTSFGIEDHGVLSFMIHLEWRGGGQGLGGYALDYHVGYTKDADGDNDQEIRAGFGPGLIAMRRIMEVVGVEKWEQLPGTLVRVQTAGWGSSRPPIIGHIINELWFDLKTFMAEESAKIRNKEEGKP